MGPASGALRAPLDTPRVVRIFSRLNIGGPSIHVVLLTAGLSERYETTLVIGAEEDHEGSFAELARSKGVRPEVVPTLGRSIHPWNDFVSFLAICRLLLRVKPHVVHTHTAKAGALGRLAALVTGTPIVIHTFHGTVFSGYFGRVGSTIYRSVERVLARITDVAIAVSPKVAAELDAQGIAPKNGVRVVPLGLDLDPFRDHNTQGFLRARLGLGNDATLIGCVGRLVPIKDIPNLLQACAQLCFERPNVHLAIVGDGVERSRLEQRAGELGIRERVHFTGFVSELPEVFADLDLAVNSSLNEGTPVALIEAMAAGVPVIATSVGGSPDLLRGGDWGALVPPQNPEALASAMAQILRDSKEARKRADAIRDEVIEAYRAERLVDDIDLLYRELMHEAGLTITSRQEPNIASFQ